MSALIQSLEKERAKISRNGCWVECSGGHLVRKADGSHVRCSGGWHKTFDKEIVRARVSEINAMIVDLKRKWGME